MTGPDLTVWYAELKAAVLEVISIAEGNLHASIIEVYTTHNDTFTIIETI